MQTTRCQFGNFEMLPVPARRGNFTCPVVREQIGAD